MESGIWRSNRPFISLVGTITLFQTIDIPNLLQMSKQDVIQSRQSKKVKEVPPQRVPVPAGFAYPVPIFACHIVDGSSGESKLNGILQKGKGAGGFSRTTTL
jgi:hypothetical protein